MLIFFFIEPSIPLEEILSTQPCTIEFKPEMHYIHQEAQPAALVADGC